MKAMILLGINCGFGPSDRGEPAHQRGGPGCHWIDYPRPKTGIDRRCVIGPKTVAQSKRRSTNAPRRKDRQAAGLLFVTKQGHKWAKEGVSEPDPENRPRSRSPTNVPVVQECIKAAQAA